MKNKYKPYALLMIVVGNREKQRHAPPNFYNWSKKARNCHLNRIAPGWEFCCDGVPWGMGGRSIYAPQNKK